MRCGQHHCGQCGQGGGNRMVSGTRGHRTEEVAGRRRDLAIGAEKNWPGG